MPMEILAPTLDQYKDKYENVKFDRDDNGVLTMTFHTDGGSLVWTAKAHDELAYAFADVANDRGNRVVVLTGAGDAYCDQIDFDSFDLSTPHGWYHIMFEGTRLVNNLLDIEVPVIAAINGPASIHPELPILSDITVASTTASFQDGPHFPSGIVPGDGVQYIWPAILGPNRGRYFLLTGQVLDAQKALDWGVVNEVVEPDQVLPRALELAAEVAGKTDLAIRFTRILLKREWTKLAAENQSDGFLHQAVAVMGMSGSILPDSK
ncbi:enoyl-CoA hydratase/isomerase family protein [Aeromicrobium sp.]|uniref:enoyl-CoA hydratase/isomerase family protein n=1 Tax=Aeromicrobium sp. TaxID=1871063 RepID=UPI0025BAE713|nr:enoyl-CoA hydratase/isomerase family protein [Aeromicrobium sp.]MCK5892628.1 enoyl-CoA hydratase/isomerase family protein [Aeromicrobium sp.]